MKVFEYKKIIPWKKRTIKFIDYNKTWKVKVLVTQPCPTIWDPMDYNPQGSYAHGILQARILGCHSLLQGNFPTQGWNPGLLHCRQILYHLSHQEAPNKPWGCQNKHLIYWSTKKIMCGRHNVQLAKRRLLF